MEFLTANIVIIFLYLRKILLKNKLCQRKFLRFHQCLSCVCVIFGILVNAFCICAYLLLQFLQLATMGLYFVKAKR